MATNKHSCAIKVSILLSLLQIGCLLYLAYAVAFASKSGHSSPKYAESVASNTDKA